MHQGKEATRLSLYVKTPIKRYNTIKLQIKFLNLSDIQVQLEHGSKQARVISFHCIQLLVNHCITFTIYLVVTNKCLEQLALLTT